MNCHECLSIIDEYVEHSLDSQTSDQAAAHVAECEACRVIFDELQNEREIYSRYLLKIKERPQSWNVVRAEIRKETSILAPAVGSGTFGEKFYEKFSAVFYRRPLFGATAVVLILAVGIGLWYNTAERLPDLASSGATEDESSPVENKSADPVFSNSLPINSPPSNTADADAKSASPDGDDSRILKIDGKLNGKNKSIPYSPPAVRPESKGAQTNSFITTAAVAARKTKINSTSFESSAAAFNNHIENCEMVLRSFRNAVSEKTASGFDVSYERRLAKELLNNSIKFRRAAQTQDDLPVQQLLVGLEVILDDIAKLPEKATLTDANSVKERIQESGIIAKLQIQSSLVMASN